VHALLTHLDRVGFNGAPRPLGIDAAGREVLSFVAGCGASHGDEELARVARMVRAFHEAAATVEALPDAEWQFMVGAPKRSLRRSVNAFGSCTTPLVRGVRTVDRAGARFGETRVASSGSPGSATSRAQQHQWERELGIH
jgi:hypothetical protein